MKIYRFVLFVFILFVALGAPMKKNNEVRSFVPKKKTPVASEGKGGALLICLIAMGKVQIPPGILPTRAPPSPNPSGMSTPTSISSPSPIPFTDEIAAGLVEVIVGGA